MKATKAHSLNPLLYAFGSAFRVLSIPRTLSTDSVSFPYLSIFMGKLMPVYAVSFFSVNSGRASASQNINSQWHEFDMSGINADFAPAKMVARQVFRNCTHKHSASKHMGVTDDPLYLGTTVTATLDGHSRPRPAWSSVKRNFRVYANSIKEVTKKYAGGLNCARIFSDHLSLLNRFNGLGFRGVNYREALSF